MHAGEGFTNNIDVQYRSKGKEEVNETIHRLLTMVEDCMRRIRNKTVRYSVTFVFCFIKN